MQEAAERALQSQLDEIEAGANSANNKFEGQGHTYREYVEAGRTSPDQQARFRPTSRAHSWPSTPAPATSSRSWVGATSWTRSGIAPHSRSARPGSTFKPFVYSAACGRIGRRSLLDDSP